MEGINRWQNVQAEQVSTLVKTVADYNPRTITPESKEKLKMSLNKFGLVMPLVLNDRTNNLISGHQRLQIAHEAGESEILVLHVDVDPVVEKEMNIALNNPELTGDFDEERLASLFEEIVQESEDAASSIKMMGEELLLDLANKGFEIDIDLDSNDLIDSIDDLLDTDNATKEKELRGPRNRTEETEETEDVEEEHKEKRKAQIRRIEKDQNDSGNVRYLRCKVGEDELDTILLAVEDFDQSLIPEEFNTGDPLGNFIYYAIAYYQAYGKMNHHDNPLE